MWNCDVCNQPIKQIGDGHVEWLDGDDTGTQGHGLRLVHTRVASPRHSSEGCQYRNDQMISDLHLSSFSGSDGLVHFLEMISKDDLPKSEILEMIQRIHIPGYEAARKHFRTAVEQGVIEPNLQDGFYFQSDINTVIKFIESQNN